MLNLENIKKLSKKDFAIKTPFRFHFAITFHPSYFPFFHPINLVNPCLPPVNFLLPVFHAAEEKP